MRIIGLLLFLVLVGCATNEPSESPAQALKREWPEPVGDVALSFSAQNTASNLLDVGIAVFDPGIPADESSHSKLGVFPEIRRAEARYMPVLLRDVMVASNAWGAVRVVPEGDANMPLQISASIVHSDGLNLVLDVVAVDVTGRVWLQRRYRDESAPQDYPVGQDADPYLDLYRQLANDLAEVLATLSATDLAGINQVATLRYAAGLSPEAFAGFLAQDDSGLWQVVRLPAQQDPMLARVERIRNQEYLFIDTVDEQFVDLYQTMGPTYNLWRQYGREQAIYMEDYQLRLQGRESRGRRGTFPAMEQTYNAFKWSKIQQQDLHELAEGFDNEVAPTVIEASGRVFRLSGTLDTQYAEWQNILRQIFALESGLSPAS